MADLKTTLVDTYLVQDLNPELLVESVDTAFFLTDFQLSESSPLGNMHTSRHELRDTSAPRSVGDSIELEPTGESIRYPSVGYYRYID